MNVQDVQRKLFYERKDLMPEGERRVEDFMPIPTCHYGALPEVERSLEQQPNSHKAVITDHGNVQSFPHGYKAAKAGIQLIYGMERPYRWTVFLSSITKQEMDLSEATL